MDDCGSSSHSLFGHTEEEYIPDAESVYLHREHHRQPQGCTLAQCFQLYTKEEQVELSSERSVWVRGRKTLPVWDSFYPLCGQSPVLIAAAPCLCLF